MSDLKFHICWIWEGKSFRCFRESTKINRFCRLASLFPCLYWFSCLCFVVLFVLCCAFLGVCFACGCFSLLGFIWVGFVGNLSVLQLLCV